MRSVRVTRLGEVTPTAACIAERITVEGPKRVNDRVGTSSRSRMRGFLMRARAMAMRCFCPPDSWMPPSPQLRSAHAREGSDPPKQPCGC